MLVADVIKAGEEQGFSAATTQRAKRDIGVVVTKVNPEDSRSASMWGLPEAKDGAGESSGVACARTRGDHFFLTPRLKTAWILGFGLSKRL